MRKVGIGCLLLALLCFVSAGPAAAKMRKLAQTGMTFLSIGASARAAGMGEAFNSIEGDPAAAFYNPAGLAAIEGRSFFLNRTQWIADMGVNDLAVAYSAGMYGVFALSIRHIDYGDVYGTVIDEADPRGYRETEKVDVGAYAVGLAYGRRLTDKFSLGAQLKYASQRLGENEAWRKDEPIKDATGNVVIAKNEVSTADAGFPWMAVDLGFSYDTGIKSLRITASVRNFSKQLLYENERFQLPMTFKIGLSINPLDLFPGMEVPEGHSFLLAMDGVDPRDRPEDVSFGLEYTFNDMLSIRLGRRDASQSEGGFSAGAGFKLSMGDLSGRIDYAYTNFGDVFDPVNRVSLVGSF